MGGLFSMDGLFYKFGSLLADIMILSFLWIFFSLPLFTIGSSTTALFYVATKRVSGNEGYIVRDFWKSFKTNFKQSTIAWLLMLLVVFIMITDIRVAQTEMMGNIRIVLLPLLLGVSIELLLVSAYIFPIISRFDMKLKDTIKTAFFMANKHLPTSILLLALAIVILMLVYVYPLFFMICMGTYAFAASYFFIKIFKKYRPEIDSQDEIYRQMSSTLIFDDEDEETPVDDSEFAIEQSVGLNNEHIKNNDLNDN